MRELLHKIIGLLFWALLIALWVTLLRDGRASVSAIVESVQYVAALGGALLAVTIWWVRHNVSLHRRKGPRRGRADRAPVTDADRLGRPVCWALEGAHAAAVEQQHLVIDVQDGVKVYRLP